MKNNQSNKRLSLSLTSVLLIVMVVISFYFFIQYQRTKNLLTNPTEVAQTEIKRLVNQVGKLIELPNEEIPSMATVTDKNKLTNQAFFARAQNGDKILLYQGSGKAILYRPSINKIIEVSQINFQATSSASVVTATKTPVLPTPTVAVPTIGNNVKLAIYNGTKKAGLAGLTKDKIISEMPEVDVIVTSNSKADYNKTQVFDVTGKNSAAVQKIKLLLGGEIVNSLPEGEGTTGADIVIFVGE